MTRDVGQAAQAILEQAAAQLKEGAFEGAVEAFSACLLVAPQEASAYRGRATARFQLQDWTGAASDFQRARELDPEEPENWLGFGLCLAMQNEIYPAIQVFETIVQRRPDYVRAYIQLGLLHFKLVAIAKGREYLQQALQRRPTLAERRLIEGALKEQNKLDQKRYYRPDFEALRNKRKQK